MTDNNATRLDAGWVFYDGECAVCLRWLRRIKRPLLRHGFDFAPLQAPWVGAKLKLHGADLLSEMRLILPNDKILGGADAALVLMRYVWWLWPLWLLSRIPGMMLVFRAVYRHIAANRHCHSVDCTILKGKQP